MLVFIPVFLYALFLDDLLRFALDAQEAAVATVWDYTVQDWAEPDKQGEYGGFSQVQGYARLMYCDHESGVDSYDDVDFDCKGEQHHEHAALTSHPCWLNTGAQQVECQAPDKQVGRLGVPIHNGYFDDYNNGGLIRCSARIGVQNYMLPQTLFPEFSKEDLAKEQQEGSIHGNAQAGDQDMQKTYLMPTEQMSILTDTWAINDDVTIEPGDKSGGDKGGEHFYKEVKSVYQDTANLGYPMLMASSAQFFSQAMSKQLLSPLQVGTLIAGDSDSPIKGDNPKSPNVSIKPFTNGMQTPSQKVEQAGQNRYFYNSEWRDWDKNNPQQSYGNRGVSYMGCKQPESC
ncbi:MULTISPECIES: hypothetical protein [Corallococcus]|nr:MULTISPECIES: hypothetical protein [Corallococcus]RKH34028.1 hypothetical protein D7X75_09985 [Corallococcus sp. CA031C]